MKIKFAFLVAVLVIPGTLFSEPGGSSKDIEQVQSDVRKMADATYGLKADAIIDFMHEKALTSLGGREVARTAISNMYASVASANLKLISLEFPSPPTFIAGSTNEFVIVPVKSVIGVGEKRGVSTNFQLGARKHGEAKWKYMEGAPVTQANVMTYFPDFPPNVRLPETSRTPLQ